MAVAVFTGDLITDVVRITGVEGDGLTPPASCVGINGARTNLVPNGGFEVDARYWQGVFTTVTPDATHMKFGLRSGRVTVTSSGQTVIARTNAAIVGAPLVRTTYAMHAWVWAEGNLVGKTVSAYFTEIGGATASSVMGGVLTNQVMVAGWNQISAVAPMAQADRTELRLNLQCAGLVAGDQFWIDGVSCYRDDFVSPYIESSEVLTPYAPVPNLAVNGDFETNTTGWLAGLSTISRVALHPKTGSSSLQVQVTTAGQAYAQYFQFITGAPLAVSRYAVGAWYWAEGSAIGKTAQLSLTETGGAAATVTVANSTATLVPGFNYLLVHGTIAQADRTGLNLFVYLIGAEIGDIYWIDDVQAGSGYVVPTPTTVSAQSGRIQLPTTGLSPKQGWVSLRLLPYWTNHKAAQDGRPDVPMTLWSWADNPSNALRLWFDGAYLTLTRTSGGVSDEAKVPWAPYRDVETTVIGSWDERGTFVSTEGQPFMGPFETFVADDFERADTAIGAGTTPVGNKPWYATQGANPPRIKNGRLQTQDNPQAGNGYAWLDLGEIPARCGGTVSYIDGGAGGSSGHTFSWTAELQVINGLLHLFQDVDSWVHQVMENGSFYYPNVGGKLYSSVIPTDGTPRDWAYATYGDTMAVETGSDRYSFRHETVARMVSRYVFWEPNRQSANGTESRHERIFVDRYGSWPGLSSNIPELTSSWADVGSNGDSTGQFWGNVLWVMAGAGDIDDLDAAVIAAIEGDPERADLSNDLQTRLVWKAETTALNALPPRSYLGNGGLVPDWS